MEPDVHSRDFTSTFGLGDDKASDLAPRVQNNILKNIPRIEAIRARMFTQKTIVLYTPIACRQLRRDFNIASAKMYVYGLNRSYKAEIEAAFEGLEFAISLLEMDVAKWVNVPNPLTARNFDLLLISPQSVKMMRSLQAVDRCMVGVYGAYLGGDLSREDRDLLLRPFHMAYLEFKRVAMKLDLNATAQEMVDAMN